MRQNRSLLHNEPLQSYITYQPGETFLLWRENVISNLIDEYMGPLPIIKLYNYNNMNHIRIVDGYSTPLNLYQVKAYV